MELTMPMLDMTSEEMTIVRWIKRVGDQVRKGEPIVEVMTEKVNIEVEAPYDGVLTAFLEFEGAVVKVGKPIAIIAVPGEEPVAAAAPASPAPAGPTPAGPAPAMTIRGRAWESAETVEVADMVRPFRWWPVVRPDCLMTPA